MSEKSKFATSLSFIMLKINRKSSWARLLNISPAAITQWFNDSTIPNRDNLKLIRDIVKEQEDPELDQKIEFLFKQDLIDITPNHRKFKAWNLYDYLADIQIEKISYVLRNYVKKSSKKEAFYNDIIRVIGLFSRLPEGERTETISMLLEKEKKVANTRKTFQVHRQNKPSRMVIIGDGLLASTLAVTLRKQYPNKEVVIIRNQPTTTQRSRTLGYLQNTLSANPNLGNLHRSWLNHFQHELSELKCNLDFGATIGDIQIKKIILSGNSDSHESFLDEFSLIQKMNRTSAKDYLGHFFKKSVDYFVMPDFQGTRNGMIKRNINNQIRKGGIKEYQARHNIAIHKSRAFKNCYDILLDNEIFSAAKTFVCNSISPLISLVSPKEFGLNISHFPYFLARDQSKYNQNKYVNSDEGYSVRKVNENSNASYLLWESFQKLHDEIVESKNQHEIIQSSESLTNLTGRYKKNYEVGTTQKVDRPGVISNKDFPNLVVGVSESLLNSNPIASRMALEGARADQEGELAYS